MEDAVAQDAGVVHHAVDAAKIVDGGLDDALCALWVGDTVAVGDGYAAGLLDLGYHLVGDLDVGPLAFGGAAEVIHHHLGAFGRREQGNLAADAASGPRHNDHLAIN